MARKKQPTADQETDGKQVVLAIRVTPEERDQIHFAAMKVGGRQYMTQWVREILLDAAKKVLK